MNTEEPKVDEKLAVAHGLKPDEYQRLVALIGRKPTLTELEAVLGQVEMLAEAKP